MNRPIWIRTTALLLAVLLTGCSASTPATEPTSSTVSNSVSESTTPIDSEVTTDPVHEHNHIPGEIIPATCTSEGSLLNDIQILM